MEKTEGKREHKYTRNMGGKNFVESQPLWDKSMRRKEIKIRKPMVIKEWFGDESTDSSDDSEADSTSWKHGGEKEEG